MPNKPLAVDMTGIVKRFPGVLAVDGADFKVAQGEIHALLGENGAGKSTLMAVLSGRLVPEEGKVRLFGRAIKPGSPKAAIEAGVGMVYQHIKLVPSLTVAENMLLGRERNRLGLGTEAVAKRLTELGERFRLPVDPQAKVWRLSLGERQRVEILRLLLFQARILILDEPTAILTALETVDLFQALKQLRDEGRSIVFISHKLEEVMELADRITILTRGRLAASIKAEQTNKRDLAKLMIASDWTPVPLTRKKIGRGPDTRPALKITDLSVQDDMGLVRLDSASLTVWPGEVMGVAGIAGNGQRELAEAVTGVRPPWAGQIEVDGRNLTGRASGAFIEAGVGFVPEDRQGAGSVVGLNLIENLMLKDYRTDRFSRGLWLDWKAARRQAEKLIQDFDIRPPDPLAKAGALSGGNLQKLLLARELNREPKLIVAAYPLRGLDLASAGFVQQVLNRHRDEGGAVLFIGEDLDSLLEVSDRVAVLFRGRVTGVFVNDNLSTERLGLMMAGEADPGEVGPGEAA